MKKYDTMLRIKEFLGRIFSWKQTEKMKELFISILNFFGMAWWVEIVTENPGCIYYFGPFVSAEEANTDKVGYMEDLEQEGAKAIAVNIKRCKPAHLTIDKEQSDRYGKASPAFSSQWS